MGTAARRCIAALTSASSIGSAAPLSGGADSAPDAVAGARAVRMDRLIVGGDGAASSARAPRPPGRAGPRAAIDWFISTSSANCRGAGSIGVGVGARDGRAAMG
jgi:hypothetical protein